MLPILISFVGIRGGGLRGANLGMGRTMKKFVLGGLIAVFAAGSAVAADMPLKAPPAPVTTPTWTGTYIGINGGYAWGPVEPEE